MITKNKPLRSLFSLLQLLVGTAMTAAAFGWIIVPQGFAAGGVTGLSRILCSVIPIPLSVMVYCLNIPLLLMAWIFVGKRYLVRTMAVSLLFPAMLEVFSRYVPELNPQDTFINILIAGALLGAGTGLVLRSNASCGGFDNLGVVLNRKLNWPVATVVRVCDCTVLLIQAVSQPLMPTVYGIFVILITTFCISRVVTMGTGETQVMIYSQHHSAIRDAFLQELDVGVTMLKAETGYRRSQLDVIVSVMPYSKIAHMKTIVNDIDPTAFVVVEQIHSVLGKGYTFNRDHLPEPPAE